MEERETTVAELIAKLQQFPPTATVGVKAACCVYTHPICLADVRHSDQDQRRLGHTDVVIEVH